MTDEQLAYILVPLWLTGIGSMALAIIAFFAMLIFAP